MIEIFRKLYEILGPPLRRKAALVLGLMFVGMLLETLGIGLLIPVISLLTLGDLSRYPTIAQWLGGFGGPGQPTLILAAMVALVGVFLIKNLFLMFVGWFQNRFAFGLQVELSQRLFTTYLRQPYTFHLQRNSAQLFHNISNEVGMLGGTVSHAMTLITECLVLTGIATLLVVVEPLGAVIVILVLSGAAFGFHHFTRAQIARWGELRQHHSELSVQHLMQGLGGAKDVKLLGRETEFLTRFEFHNASNARAGQSQATLQQLPRLVLEFLMVIGLAILVLTMVAQGRDMAAITPTLGLFAAAAFRLTPSLNRILYAIQALRYDLPVLQTLRIELDLDAPAPQQRSPGPAPVFHDAIRIENVHFTYPNAPAAALTAVDLIIRRGESVGLIGPSGSGKSTLVDIILGLLPCDAGCIRVDGADIAADLRAWQDQIGYVPQAIYLTDDSIRRNIAFGLADDQIDDAAVARALRAAHLEQFVAELPAGVETLVGERGIRLSGGQRQRIGIARALYHDPAVLVLDEATSSLDTAVEQGVMAAVNRLHGEKTLLIVAHRLSTVEHCDRLYRVEQGTITGEGAVTELVRLPV